MRDQQMLLERARGETLQAIGARHEVSYQRVQAVERDARHMLDRLELEMLKNTKTDELEQFVIPYGPGYTTAVAFVDWLVRELRGRGVKVKVHHQKASNGVAFFLEDVTPYGRSN